jgi:LPS-assembly protein
MKFQQRVCLALSLCLIFNPVPAWSASSGTEGQSAGYLCVPNTSGDGWDCGEDSGERPVIYWDKIVPYGSRTEPVPVAPRSAEAQSVVPQQATASSTSTPPPGIDPNTGMSSNPDDWYTPTAPRGVDEAHEIKPDLAASIYAGGGSGMCPGGYQPRAYPHPRDSDPEQFPILVEADQLSTRIDVSATLTGNVTIEQGNRTIVADAAELDYPTRVVQFPAGVRMDQPGVVMQGDSAEVHLNSKEAQMENAQFVLTDASMRGRTQQLTQNAAGDLTMTGNAFTRCEPGNNDWLLSARELVVEDDAVFGTARGAVLRMKSVPVFYTPYMQFPVSDERLSGFLFPDFGYSDEDGVDFSIPYYLNLAPNYDATITPRYISERGEGVELELRHLASWESTVLGGAYLPEDDLYNGFVSRDDYDEQGGSEIWETFDPADRWLGAVDHRGRLGPLRTFIDYAAVSDRDYFRDLGTDLGVSSRRALESRGGVQLNTHGLSMRLWAQRFQRLDEVTVDEYQRLPELRLAYANRLFGPLSFSVNTSWSEFDRDTDGLDGLAAVTGSRMHVEPRLQLGYSRAWGFLNMTGGYRYTSYDLQQDADAGGLQILDESPDRNIGMASVDGSLIFERDLNWFGESLVQTLEPRVYYLWQEFDDQSQLPLFDTSELTFGYSQLFRDNRFSGLDRIGDADQASFGVTTRFLSQSSGREYFRFSVGEIFYFDDRQVTLRGDPGLDEMQDNSALAAEMSAALAGNWYLLGNIVWDHDDNQVDEGGAAIQYRRDNRHIFNIGFRNRRDEDIEQTDLSLYWPISDHFAIMGRWNYDLVSGRTIEGFGGIEYGNCCLQVRLMARRFLNSPSGRNFQNVEADESVILQVVFKGLAGFGTKIESALERGIRGYRAPDQRDYFSNP